MNARKGHIFASIWAAALLLVALASPPHAVAHIVTLREDALVQGPTIRLSELADIEGEMADTLGGIEIADAAQPGSTRRLARSLVELRVRNAGIDSATVELRGPQTVLATTLSRGIAPEEITASLRAFILENMPWNQEDTEVDIPLPRDGLIIPEGAYEIVWRANPQYGYVGNGTFRGAVLVDGIERHTLLCRARVEAYSDIVVAARDVARGRIITKEDVTTRKQRVSQAPRGAIPSKQDAIGLLSRKTLFQGQPVTSHSLEARRVIRRNQIVAVEMQHGAVWLQSQARALSDARPGDLVMFANLNTKQEFQGYVREDGSVVVL